mmetsp:Transcript_137624/g.239281  ORF Transcript_137624/g.239281 Transcript_137624/m.239281 type:complete len:82 (+) Transcript_137624:341-586(+)
MTLGAYQQLQATSLSRMPWAGNVAQILFDVDNHPMWSQSDPNLASCVCPPVTTASLQLVPSECKIQQGARASRWLNHMGQG